jgi:hypothetical protein
VSWSSSIHDDVDWMSSSSSIYKVIGTNMGVGRTSLKEEIIEGETLFGLRPVVDENEFVMSYGLMHVSSIAIQYVLLFDVYPNPHAQDDYFYLSL